MANQELPVMMKWARVMAEKVLGAIISLVLGMWLGDLGRPVQGTFLRLVIAGVATVLFILLINFMKRRWQDRSWKDFLLNNVVLFCFCIWLGFMIFFLTVQTFPPCTPTPANITQIGVLKSEDVHESVKNLVWIEEDGEQILGVATAEAVYVYQPTLVPILHQLWINKQEVFRGRTMGLALDPQGQYLAFGYGISVLVRDIKKNDKPQSWLEHPGTVTALDYSPKGEWLASASEDGTIKIWRRIGRLTDTFKCKGGSVTTLRYQPILDGKMACGTEDGKVFLFDPKNRDQQFLLGSREGVVTKSHDGAVTSLSFDRRGRRLMSSGLDGTIKLWDANTGINLLTINVNAPVLSATFFGDENALLVATDKGGGVAIWDSNTGEQKKVLTEAGSMPAYSVATGFGDRILAFGRGADNLWGLALVRWWVLSPNANCP